MFGGNQGIAWGKPTTIRRSVEDFATYNRRVSQQELDLNSQQLRRGAP